MQTFKFQRASGTDEAVSLLQKNSEAKLLAGGQTLLASLKLRLANPELLVDLSRIPGLSQISTSPDALTIGAMVKHAEVARSPEVTAAIPALAELAISIGDPMIRNRGTIGGSIANNDPAADYPAAVLALGATLVTTQRRIAADEFFLGMFETSLAPDEIITAIEFPIPRAAAYVKVKHPASRFALVGVFVARTVAGVRLAVTGAGPCVFRIAEMEQALDKDFTPEAIASIQIPTEGLNADLQATAEYRAQMVKAIAQRAVAATAKSV